MLYASVPPVTTTAFHIRCSHARLPQVPMKVLSFDNRPDLLDTVPARYSQTEVSIGCSSEVTL